MRHSKEKRRAARVEAAKRRKAVRAQAVIAKKAVKRKKRRKWLLKNGFLLGVALIHRRNNRV